MPIGAKATLRGDRMWEFLDRLLSLALPRIRDFRGLSDTQFDGNGNYTFGLTEQSMFHEIDPDSIDRPRGMDITVVTTAKTMTRDARCSSCSASPLRRTEHGQDSTRMKAARKPKFAVRGTRAASGADVRTRSTRSSACAGSACARWPTRANCPVSRKPVGKNPLRQACGNRREKEEEMTSTTLTTELPVRIGVAS